MTGSLLRTPLADWHSAHGGRMVDFAGWSMPVQYGSIVAEHQATRLAAGLFDVSHMGRLRLTGSGAEAFLDRLLTRKVAGLSPGKIATRSFAMRAAASSTTCWPTTCSPRGRGEYFLLVVNASNRDKIYHWLLKQRQTNEDVQIADSTIETAMIAVQGPAAIQFVQPLASAEIGSLAYYTGTEMNICGAAAICEPHGLYGRGWLRIDLAGGDCDNGLEASVGEWAASRGDGGGPGSSRYLAAGKRRCRCMGTSFPNKLIRSKPVWRLP